MSRSLLPAENEVYLLRTAVEATRSPLILTDAQQKDNPIVYANQAFLDLTGYEADEIIGRNCRFLQGKDSEQSAVGEIRQAVKQGEHSRVTLKNYRKDGTPFWNDLVISPVRDDAGIITHFIGMQLDITSRVELEDALRRGERELRRSNRELEQFAHAASHDLQEPLRMVRSFMQLLEQRYSEQLDDTAREFIGYAVEGAERMQSLINDLLQLSRVGTAATQVRPVEVETALRRALDNLRTAISDSKAELVVPDTLPTVRADATQMTLLFQNLIANAIKYHRPDTTPRVEIRVERARDHWRIEVIDNGIGIDEQYKDRIFEIFQRLHTREEYAGTGIGLTICRKIVDGWGGRIWVESVLDQGATFVFTIPARQKGAHHG